MIKDKIVIEPVTRVEGHGKVTIHLDEKGEVAESRFHIVEFRGFEKFIQGRPYWEAPVIVQRLCGICPVSHHLAAAKAIDQIVGVYPDTLSVGAEKMRRLMHYGQVFQSHALHFFYLASPDLLFGIDAPPKERSIVAVIEKHKDLALKGIQLRKFGQEIIKATAGKKIHGISAVPGGIHKNLQKEEAEVFLKGLNSIPSIELCIEWMQEILDFILNYHTKNKTWMEEFCHFESNFLSLVDDDGAMDLYHGRLRAIDANGRVILDDIDYQDYLSYFSEEVKAWTYLKFPYLKSLGPKKGWNSVGPLARLNVCQGITTPLAQSRLEQLRSFTGKRIIHHSLYYHWARLIEMLHCAEQMQNLLLDPDLQSDQLLTKGARQREGISVIEAPRGTLLHHYRVGDDDLIERCNLIVSTTHNNEPMNKAVNTVAVREFKNEAKVTEAMLNAVEVAIRAYDPCLSCATHAVGEMPLMLEVFDANDQSLMRSTK